ncbi:MAG: GYD domain-containing protein [Anaerolineales bacterium]|nr:MAG: GYD domain-containing protein [Anaerolineales bacterium]
MGIYLMFGEYSMDSIGKISADRTVRANAVVKGLGGEIKGAYAILGEKDLVLIAEFPGTKEAMKASVELAKLLGISFTTAPAVTVEEFDKLVGTG